MAPRKARDLASAVRGEKKQVRQRKPYDAKAALQKRINHWLEPVRAEARAVISKAKVRIPRYVLAREIFDRMNAGGEAPAIVDIEIILRALEREGEEIPKQKDVTPSSLAKRKAIVAHYKSYGSPAKTAARFGVSITTVQRYAEREKGKK